MTKVNPLTPSEYKELAQIARVYCPKHEIVKALNDATITSQKEKAVNHSALITHAKALFRDDYFTVVSVLDKYKKLVTTYEKQLHDCCEPNVAPVTMTQLQGVIAEILEGIRRYLVGVRKKAAAEAQKPTIGRRAKEAAELICKNDCDGKMRDFIAHYQTRLRDEASQS